MENMSEFKGTKGRWEVSPIMTCKVLGLGMETICELPTYENKNFKANAQLISKSPEMLEMLEIILESQDAECHLESSINDSIKQLIKEATTI